MIFEAGDILFVAFPFEDSDEEKERPALFWQYRGADFIVVSKITSRRRGLPFEMPMPPFFWNGLAKPSYVRLDQTVKISLDKVKSLRPLGRVNPLQLHILHEKLKEFLASKYNL